MAPVPPHDEARGARSSERPQREHDRIAWSLAAEEQFYVLWPPILRALRGLRAPAVAMTLLVAVDQAAERGALGPLLEALREKGVLVQEDGLALSVARSFATPIGLSALPALALAWVRTSGVAARLIDAVLARRWSSAAALAAVVVAVVVPWPLLPTQAALTALVVAVARRRDHVLAPLLEHAAVKHVGVVSYGNYLLNVPVVSLVRSVLGADGSAAGVFAAALPACVLAATLTHRLVERPFLALHERLSSS